MDIKDYIKLFSVNQISVNTAKSYEQELRRFHNYTQTDLHAISIAHILKYRNSLTSLHPVTIAWKISVIRSFFSFLVQEQVISHNPALSVKSLRVKRYPHFPRFAQHHFQLINNNVNKNTFRQLRDHCLFQCMGRLGMRVSEVCNLTLESMDNDSDFPVFLILGKGNAIRSIPMLDRISETINKYLRKYPFSPTPDSPLFPATAKTLRPLSPRGVQYIVRRNCRQVGLSDQITPHTLRHFAMSTLLKEGHDLFTIQTFAGHSQLATTARYLHNLKQQEDYTMNICRSNSLIRTISLL